MEQKNYLKISEADLKKVQARKERAEAATVKVDPEWLAIARLGKHYGWGAIVSVLGDKMTDNPSGELMAILNKAGDIVDNQQYYMMHQAAFVGARIAKVPKNASKKFEKATKDLIKASKADING